VVPPTLVNTLETRADLAAYYDEITRLDYYVGQLQSAIAEEGIANNTVIIFLSDNGRPFPGSKPDCMIGAYKLLLSSNGQEK